MRIDITGRAVPGPKTGPASSDLYGVKDLPYDGKQRAYFDPIRPGMW